MLTSKIQLFTSALRCLLDFLLKLFLFLSWSALKFSANPKVSSEQKCFHGIYYNQKPIEKIWTIANFFEWTYVSPRRLTSIPSIITNVGGSYLYNGRPLMLIMAFSPLYVFPVPIFFYDSNFEIKFNQCSDGAVKITQSRRHWWTDLVIG